MENLDDKDDGMSKLADSMKAIEKFVNPWKGTAIESILESQKKLKKFANPFKGTAIESILENQKRLEKIVNPLKGTAIEAAMKATQEISEQMQKYKIPLSNPALESIMERERAWEKSSFLLGQNEKYMANSFAAEKLMQVLASSKMASESWRNGLSPFMINGTLINNSSWRSFQAAFVFTHLDLYENYDEDGNQQVEEPKETKSPIILLDDVIKVQTLIKSIYEDNNEIYKIDSYDFERMIAELLRAKGLGVEITKRTRDGGKDIIALHDLGALGVNKYLVECKRWRADRGVDVDVVRSICFTVTNEKANKGMIFTSSYFTKDAYKLKEQQKSLLEFRDGAAILDWVSEYLKANK